MAILNTSDTVFAIIEPINKDLIQQNCIIKTKANKKLYTNHNHNHYIIIAFDY